jgi:hypothetical protein
MTLTKFVSIKNIGRFQNYNTVGDVVLKRVNLVFAENGDTSRNGTQRTLRQIQVT